MSLQHFFFASVNANRIRFVVLWGREPPPPSTSSLGAPQDCLVQKHLLTHHLVKVVILKVVPSFSCSISLHLVYSGFFLCALKLPAATALDCKCLKIFPFLLESAAALFLKTSQTLKRQSTQQKLWGEGLNQTTSLSFNPYFFTFWLGQGVRRVYSLKKIYRHR